MTAPLSRAARSRRSAEVIEVDAWLVGGALRDRLLGRSTADFDVAVDGEVRALAKALARHVHAHVFALSEGFGGPGA